MTEDRQCFEKQVVVPAVIIDIVPRTNEQASLQSSEFQEIDDLIRYLSTSSKQAHTCRLISICQYNSWEPLGITEEMFDLLLSEQQLSRSAHHIASCFYTRISDTEESFCVPVFIAKNEMYIEISYTLRYPEYKRDEKRWRIRQTGLQQCFNPMMGQNTIFLYNPMPDSAAYKQMEAYMLEYKDSITLDLFWAHTVLLSTYLPKWRYYIAWLESDILKLTNYTLTSFIDRELRISAGDLNKLVYLINQLAQVRTLISHTTDTIEELLGILRGSNSPQKQTKDNAPTLQLENHLRTANALSRTAVCLHQRAQASSQLLSNTLALRDQVVAHEQNKNTFQLSKTAVYFTKLTLFYLPISFISSFFGMSFFNFDATTKKIAVSPDIWIFVFTSAVLTTVTIRSYYRPNHGGYKFREHIWDCVNVLFTDLWLRMLSFANRNDRQMSPANMA